MHVDDAFEDIVREIRRFNKDMSGYPGTANGRNGATNQMDVDEGENTGCCGSGKCTVM